MTKEAEAAKRPPDCWKWFTEGRYGMFIHWGPSSQYAKGEQVLYREHLDQKEYAEKACGWRPESYDPKVWAKIAVKAGFKYACLTTRHHDGYCLWDTRYTDYSSARQAPKRDFVREFAEAFRAEGLRIGLYYSLGDWRIPAFYEGPERNPEGWKRMREYIHNQVEELLTGYGRIDQFYFDGIWPRDAHELGSVELMEKMRALQPDILINNRLALPKVNTGPHADGGMGAGASEELGDFGTPEHNITAEPGRLWESCQVTTWRLWGYAAGERWRPADVLLDMLCECVEKGGNLLLNVGPQADGQLPPEFVQSALEIGKWLEVHGEAVYGEGGGDITEFVTRGRQTTRGNNLYLIIRFWDGEPEMRLMDMITPVKRVTLLTTGQKLDFDQRGEGLTIKGLPKERPTRLFPVIKIECGGEPRASLWGKGRLWTGDAGRIAQWARTRGESVYVDGRER